MCVRGEIREGGSGCSFQHMWSNLHDSQDLVPLFVRGVRAGGIVGTHVEEYDGMFRSPSQVFQEAPRVNSTAGLVPVAVPADICEPRCF